MNLTAIAVILTSLHLPYAGQNQTNPGLVAEIERDYRVGAYVNSHNKVTVFGAYSYPLVDRPGLRVGLNLGLGTGYPSPVVGGVEVTIADHLVILAVPKIGREMDSTVLGFALRIPLE